MMSIRCLSMQGVRVIAKTTSLVMVVWVAASFFATQSLAAACANEGLPGFRSYMADCRGYELVTPPYTAGAPVRSLSAISPDGRELIGASFGGFAGTENNEVKSTLLGAAVYRFTRDSAGGWQAESQTPPATAISHSEYISASKDANRTLWGVIEPPSMPSEQPPEKEILGVAQPYLLLIREQLPGREPRYIDVGAEDSPTESIPEEDFNFVGASDDLGHILYTIDVQNGAAWPGDTTNEGASSLYEYAGEDNTEPWLVGVSNVGHPPGGLYINEGAELISHCGTVLGAPTGKFNAISASGNVVFFTALACTPTPVANEIYARVDQKATVPISEPRHPLAQGAGPGSDECDVSCEGNTVTAASFAGASRDGTKVFFTTTQSLVNGDEGGKGSGNDLYEAEIARDEVARLTQVSRSYDPAVPAEVLGVSRVTGDGNLVYFVAHGALTTTPGPDSQLPVSGQPNLYVYSDSTREVRFIGTLSASDALDWAPVDVHKPFETSANGRFAIFLSKAKLTGAEDTSVTSQLFEYDTYTGSLARVSIGRQSGTGYLCSETNELEHGYNCNGNTDNPSFAPRIASPTFLSNFMPSMADSTLSITNDGRVVFSSLDALVPGALEGSKNVYEYSDGQVYLVSIGEDKTLERATVGEGVKEEGRLISVDESGQDVFFGAVGSLVPTDTNSQLSIYDAREGGDGGSSIPSVGAECGADCHVADLTPRLDSAASALISGKEALGASRHIGGNVHKKRRVSCAHGPRRRRSVCRRRKGLGTRRVSKKAK